VGGYLYLGGTAITSLPENLTVGSSLYLGGCTGLTSLPENLTVGGEVYSDVQFKNIPKKLEDNYVFQWRNGKFIQVDDVMTEVIHTRGNTRKVRIVGKKVDSYLVSDGNGKWAHGETLAKAKEDLQFKVVAEKLKKDPIKPDTIITPQYYRIITGACELGVKSWMEQNGIETNKIKAADLFPILEKTNAYGFERFKQLVIF
jgi:predicted peroxiredoxin